MTRSLLIALALALLLLALAGAVLDLTRGRLLVRVGNQLDSTLGPRIYDLIVRLSLRSRQGSDSVQPVRDLETIRAFLSGTGPTAFFDLPWLPFYLAICFAFHVWIGVTALAGALVLVLFRGGTWRRRSELVAVTLVAFAAAVAISQIPDPEPAPSPATAAAVAPTRRTLFTSSGRRAAWRGAIRQAADRPLLGYGFGTEEDAFVNRYAGFASELPENSYIGAALQLGLAGLGLFLAAVVLAFGRFARRIERWNAAARPCAAACAGGAVAALVGAITQSYVFSVGNVATVTAWLSMFLLASATDRAE
jgi:O-antigen ligase